MTPDPATAALIEQMWQRFRPVAEQRLAVLDRLVAAARAGDVSADLRAEAASAAHKLAGALGTYGCAGSDAARELEALLRGSDELGAADALTGQVRGGIETGPAVHPPG